MINNLELMCGRVLLKNILPEDDKTPSGLILPKTKKDEKFGVSVVLKVADDCESVKVGDKVYFSKALKETITNDDTGEEEYLVVKEEDIYFIIHED